MKVINIELESCSKCPYMDWEMPGDSWDGGMICGYGDNYTTIIDHYEYKNQSENHDGPILGKDYVPDWCPLPNKITIIKITPCCNSRHWHPVLSSDLPKGVIRCELCDKVHDSDSLLIRRCDSNTEGLLYGGK